MNDEQRATRGQSIKQRLDRIGMSQRAFAAKGDIDRTTLSHAIEDDPSVSERSYKRIEAKLDELETEMGYAGAPQSPDGAGDQLEYSIAADAIGLNITVRGPISDREELEQSVLRIVREMGIKS